MGSQTFVVLNPRHKSAAARPADANQGSRWMNSHELPRLLYSKSTAGKPDAEGARETPGRREPDRRLPQRGESRELVALAARPGKASHRGCATRAR